MEEICYGKNPIKEAIARIDFLNFIPEFRESIPESIVKKIKEHFPIAESKDVISKELRFEPNNVIKHTEIKVIEWNFYNKDRTRRLCIADNSMFLVCQKYEKLETFFDDYILALDAIYDYKKDIQLKRFGVRYINNIVFTDGDPLDWKTYLNPNLLSIFEIPRDKKLTSRAFHNLELNFGDYNVRFQYGMHNPDYPATIKKKEFILDLDAYYTGIMMKSDIEDFFPKFHQVIQELFEGSITDDYRAFLNS